MLVSLVELASWEVCGWLLCVGVVGGWFLCRSCSSYTFAGVAVTLSSSSLLAKADRSSCETLEACINSLIAEAQFWCTQSFEFANT